MECTIEPIGFPSMSRRSQLENIVANRFLLSVFILSVLLLGLILGSYASDYLNISDRDQYKNALHLAVLLVLPGAFGGLLVSFQERPLALPKLEAGNFSPGFLSDVGFGVGGSIVVFYLARSVGSPGNSELTFPYNDALSGFELVGVSILGGYAGRRLVESAANRLQNKVNQIDSELDKIKSTKEADESAELLVSRILNCRAEPSPSQVDAFGRILEHTSPTARETIYDQAESARADRWQQAAIAAYLKDDSRDAEISAEQARSLRTVKNSRYIFERLTHVSESESGAIDHRYIGSLGFVLHDTRDHKNAIEALLRARRVSNDSAADYDQWYCFDLAQAYAETGDAENMRKILEEIRQKRDKYSSAFNLLCDIQRGQNCDELYESLRKRLIKMNFAG